VSSRVHHPLDLDAVLMYAPPRVRNSAAKAPIATPPKAAPPPVESPPTSPKFKSSGPSFVGDQAMLTLRRQLSLDPEVVPAPPVAINGGSPLVKMAARLCAVGCIAALGAWAAVSLTANPATHEIVQAAAAPAPAPAPAVTPVKLTRVSAAIVPPLPIAMALPARPATFTVQDRPQPHAEAAALAPPQPDTPQAAADRPVLSADEIAMLLDRGKADLMDGDISAARLLLQRAADAGNADAALTLGSTYDPSVLARLGAFGVQGDAAQAREWYQKAKALGSGFASEQLAKLTRAGE
jgi:hypothetical protein